MNSLEIKIGDFLKYFLVNEQQVVIRSLCSGESLFSGYVFDFIEKIGDFEEYDLSYWYVSSLETTTDCQLLIYVECIDD